MNFTALRCFGTVFQRPHRYFSIALKVILSLTDPKKKFTNNWLDIDICQAEGFSKIRFYVNKHKNLDTDKSLILRDLDQPTENPTAGT